ncbi:MAG: type II toxin-antitoxin system VapC family toxin [Candidatus Brockarchaeota archaeon]|nr:type II toxin-antitoxin system VapC family toxin [Candidatus Brockarchaeota archaeon]
MRNLYDASALLNVIRMHKQEAYRTLKDNLTLSLAKYEIGNALWKEALLQKRISVEEAIEIMILIEKVLKIMRIIEPSNNSMVLRLACELQITFYDASYVVASVESKARLVTDDVGLIRKIRGNASTVVKILGGKPEMLSSNKTPYSS